MRAGSPHTSLSRCLADRADRDRHMKEGVASAAQADRFEFVDFQMLEKREHVERGLPDAVWPALDSDFIHPPDAVGDK
jgi:hypothetical protein